MLDPVQREALAAARKGGVVVSGGPGTGKSRLANALAADAVSRGLTCLLVGDDAELDNARDVGKAPLLHPKLAARMGVSFAAVRAAGGPADPVSLRASLFPEDAALARRILGRAREIQAEHGFAAAEVAAAAVRRMPSPKTMALIDLACADATVVADAFWGGNARPGRTMGEIASLLRGGQVETPADEESLLAAVGGADYEALRELLLEKVEEDAGSKAGLADLQRSLDPWAWGNAHGTVGELHASLKARAVAFSNAANLLRQHGSMEAAIAGCAFGDNSGLALSNYRRSFPGIDGREAEAAIRRHSLREEGRADALAPFLAAHAKARLSDVQSYADRPEERADAVARLDRLAFVNDAAARLTALLSDLARALPPAAMGVIQGKPLDDVSASIAYAREENERTRSLRELAGLRSAFSKAGFGDVMAVEPGFEARLAQAVELEDASRPEPESPRSLDIFLDVEPAGASAGRPWTGQVSRWRPAQAPLHSAGRRFDVVVVDDAASLGEVDLAALRALSPVVHLVGAPRGKGLDLPVPHRSLAGSLANLGRPAGERGWAGAPGGAGVVVRTLPEGVDPKDALLTALVAVRGVGQSSVDAHDGQGVADVVVLAGDTVTEAEVVAAGARARSALLVLAHECAWKPGEPAPGDVPADERMLAAAGWTLVANAEDGRVYTNGERSVIVTDEPDGYDMLGENVAGRVARLAAAGWSPIVAWRGSPRGADDMLRLVERHAVENGSHLEMELATFPLPRPKARPAGAVAPEPRRMDIPGAGLPRLAFEDIPASPHAEGTFEDVVWRLKWIREEVLLKANPDRAACLLTDERIHNLIRMGIDDAGMWDARFRGAMLRGVDRDQLAIREVVMDVVGSMPRGPVALHTRAMVEAVAFEARSNDQTVRLLPDGAALQAEPAEEAPRLGM